MATIAKFGASYVAARLAGQGCPESTVLGILMNTRALMELIVINVGFDLGVISQHMFTMLVIMAITSTVITTPLVRLCLPRCGVAGHAAARASAPGGRPVAGRPGVQ